MRYVVVALAVFALALPAVANAAPASSFDGTTLTVTLSYAAPTTNVTCDPGSGHVLVGGGADTGVSCGAVRAIDVEGGPESDAIGLGNVTATTFPALTSVTANTGAGNDNYIGSAIGDTVNLGAADTPGGDVITPGAANDHITCPGGCQVTENLTGTDTLTDSASTDPGGGGTDSFSGVTAFVVRTSGANPTVDGSAVTVPITFDGFGNSAGQRFVGGSANDSFAISAGNATIDGGGGANSLLVAAPSSGNVSLGATTLTAPGSASFQNIQSATITGGSGDNVYDWSSFAGPVVLSDISGQDSVTAGPGNDSITLFGGAATVNAGGGNDQIYLRGNPTAHDSIDGGSGSNTLSWSETTPGTIIATDTGLSTPDGTVALANIGALTLLGTNGNDMFDARGFSGPVTIAGYGGQDVMLSGPGADSLSGFADSTDCFNGGPGADSIDGGGSSADTDVVDPADTLVSGSTYTPVSSCGDGDSAPTGSTSSGGSTGAGAGADTVPPVASAQISAWGTKFAPTTYGGSVSVIGFASDPSPSSGAPTVRCALDPATVPSGYDALPSGPCTQTTTTVGPHSFYVAARDPAGNTSGVASVSFTIVAVPDTLIIGGPTGGTWAAAPEYSFISTVAGSTFACSVDGGPATACTSPHAIGPFGAGSAHTFAVAATSPAGFSDPTPAVAHVTINATQVTSNACEVTPVPTFRPQPPPSVALACMFRYAIPADCGANYRCIHSPDGCPAAASCTLTTKATWTDGDSGDGWIIPAWATLTSTTNPAITAGALDAAVCREPDDNRFCTATKTSSLVGPATMEGQCDPTEDPDTAFGSDADRDLKCRATVTITPAVPLSPITIGDGVDLFVPGGGKLTVMSGGKVGADRSAAARREQTRRVAPGFRATTLTVPSAREVRFIPKLSPAAQRTLKLHHKLKLTVLARFLPSAGGTTLARTFTTTLTGAAPRTPRGLSSAGDRSGRK